jgi:N6-adenosine-specific RNA methylase IME4
VPQMIVPIASIERGRRHRRDLGDIASLAASIRELGLLHPVVITRRRELVAGERRLEACRALGWTDVPVTVIDLAEIARGEAAENFERKNFTPSEAVAIKRALEPQMRAAAKERQGVRTDLQHGGNLPPCSFGKTRDKAARFTGLSPRTLDKAEEIVQAADADPDRFGKLKQDMDRTGRVEAPWRRLRNMQQAALICAEPPPLPSRGPYRVIVVDPPWPYEVRMDDPSHRGVIPYPTMSLEAIKRIPVASIAHSDCVLWLWTINAYMRHAFAVLDAWGFVDRSILTWGKPHYGRGDWLRGQTEHAIMAVRGEPRVTLSNQSTLLLAPYPKDAKHSAKPDEFYALVERLCPAPRYAELFARRVRPNWDGHGNEMMHRGAAAE